MLRQFANIGSLMITACLLCSCTILDDNRWPVGHRKIILSFDDGPNPEISDALLAVLRAQGVRATFCFVGRNAQQYPQQVARVVAEGHALAYHGYSRAYPAIWGYATMLRELELARQALNLSDFSGDITPDYYRPPRGLVTPTVRRLIKQTDLKMAYLSFYIHDAPLGPEDIDGLFERFTRKISAHHGAAIVLHESRFKSDPEADNTVDKRWLPGFVERLIIWAKAEGYEFVQYADAPDAKT